MQKDCSKIFNIFWTMLAMWTIRTYGLHRRLEYLDHMVYLEHTDAGIAQQSRSFRLREHVCAHVFMCTTRIQLVSCVFFLTLFQPELVGERAVSRGSAQLAVQPAAQISVQSAAQLAVQSLAKRCVRCFKKKGKKKDPRRRSVPGWKHASRSGCSASFLSSLPRKMSCL